MRDYERLSIEEFGKHLLETEDLDPIYCALVRSGWEKVKVQRWLVSYWCFYSAPVACYMCDLTGMDFWDAMKAAARNEEPAPNGGRWPRGHERRHFRGKAATEAVKRLRGPYPAPNLFVERVCMGGGTVREIMDRVKNHYLFGDWIGFKVADMAERVLGLPVNFDNGSVFMFADPTKAAIMLWRQKLGHDPKDDRVNPKNQREAIDKVVEYLLEYFKGYNAPPNGDRPVNVQEVETILCKWKSHLNGHYPLHNDTDEINTALEQWKETSPNVVEFMKAMPQHDV